MNEQPDGAWRLKWLQSKDALRSKLGPSATKATKPAQSPSGLRIVVQKSRKHLWR
jgi:hypothetical protein